MRNFIELFIILILICLSNCWTRAPQMELKAATDHLVCSCFAIQNQRLLLLPAFTEFSGGPRLASPVTLCVFQSSAIRYCLRLIRPQYFKKEIKYALAIVSITGGLIRFLFRDTIKLRRPTFHQQML